MYLVTQSYFYDKIIGHSGKKQEKIELQYLIRDVIRDVLNVYFFSNVSGRKYHLDMEKMLLYCYMYWAHVV